jgi:hypothetical protein
MTMRLPDFIIVGAMKSGTSTLRDLLTLREDLFLPPGEVHFFSDESKYARGIEWYASLFSGSQSAVSVGEKTPTYSYLPHCAARIHQHLPNVKLVWLFREPVARTYSHYWHSVKNGSERLTFPRAIELEPERIVKDRWRGYQLRSTYHLEVERYLALFPRAQMHFLLLEHLLRDPLRETNALLAFLGVKPLEATPHLPRSNQTYIPKSRTAQWAIRRLFRLRTRPYQVLSKINRRAVPGYPRLDADIQAQLRKKFLEPNRKLAVLTGLDLSVWTTPSQPDGLARGSETTHPTVSPLPSSRTATPPE